MSDELRELERRVYKLEANDQLGTERHKTLVGRLDKLDGHLTWLIRLVATGIIGAAVTFAIKGGFIGV